MQSDCKDLWNSYKLFIIEKYTQLAQKLYTKPKEEEILDSFLHVEVNSNDLTIAASSIAPAPIIRKKPEVQMKNIRNFFVRNQTSRGKPNQTLTEEEMINETVIIVDQCIFKKKIVKINRIKIFVCKTTGKHFYPIIISLFLYFT